MAAVEQADDLGFWLPDEFLDEEMFLAAQKQTPAGAAAKDEDAVDYISDLSRRMTISITDDDDENHSPSAVESINPKVMSMASSPQSTLCRTTSPNIPSQVFSPPSTPSADESEEDALELLYAAAGEITADVGLKDQWRRRRQWMPPVPCGEGALVMAQRKLAARHLAQSAYYAAAAAEASSIQQIQLFQRLRQEQLIKQHRSVAWSKQSRDRGTAVYLPERDCRTYDNNLGLSSSAWQWHPLHAHYHPRRHTYPHQTLGSAGMRAMFLNSSGRESTGTGVFLPRGGAAGNPSESTKKKSGSPTMPVPPRNVGRAANLINPDELAGHLGCQYPSGFPPCYEIDRNPTAFLFVRSDFPPLPRRSVDGGHYSPLHGRKRTCCYFRTPPSPSPSTTIGCRQSGLTDDR